jgi:hypothetical protein
MGIGKEASFWRESFIFKCQDIDEEKREPLTGQVTKSAG